MIVPGAVALHAEIGGWPYSEGDAGDEAIVNILWERYQKVDDKAEKKRLLHVFIKQFVVAFNDWEPVNSGILLESTSENFSSADDVVLGCSAGHPVEVIRVLVDEVTQLSSLVTEWAVVQLKTISGAVSADESSNIDKKDELFCSLLGFISRADAAISSSNSSKVLSTEARLHWRQKAIVSVMEAGGLNWLVGKVGICYF
ncbi:BEACH domain LvsC-like protein [Trifolium pratense]|uniref:BEACH domain LvsC-like protein n=1 Tax=Trifolium pratense TaxID=57577 RepID=A0A2K3PPI6_TRIPR|nr:BEACH domain LvsC-like protein [Trifolium pratense]